MALSQLRICNPPPSRTTVSFIGPKWHAIFWNEWKINFLFLFTICKCFYRPKFKINRLKRSAMFWNRFLCSWVFFFATFILRDMVHTIFKQWLTHNWDLRKIWKWFHKNGRFRGVYLLWLEIFFWIRQVLNASQR